MAYDSDLAAAERQIAALVAERDNLAAELAANKCGPSISDLRQLLTAAEAMMREGMEPIREFHEALKFTATAIDNPRGRWDRKIRAQAAEIQRLQQRLNDLLQRELATGQERDQLRAALYAVEWLVLHPHQSYHQCPKCRQRESQGHAPDCIVGLALGRKA